MADTHHSDTCNVPFCKECWTIIKGNIKAIKGVADSLLESAPAPTEKQG